MIAASCGRTIAAATTSTLNILSSASTLFSTPNTSIMRFRSTALAALVAGHGASAWVGPLLDHQRYHHVSSIPPLSSSASFLLSAFSPHRRPQQLALVSTSSKTSLQSAVIDDVLETPQTPKADKTLTPAVGKPIAKGPIISTFKGGLVAARVDDDLESDDVSLDPNIVDTTQSLPKAKKSSNTLGKRKQCFLAEPC